MQETRHTPETKSFGFPRNNQNLPFVEQMEAGVEMPRLHNRNIQKMSKN